MESHFNDVGRNFDYRNKQITFDMFRSFFDDITFEKMNDGFMGWTDWQSSCKTLWVGTAGFDGGCFLDTVKHATKANNPYNNFVNAIAYWDIMNDIGKAFFLKFYEKQFAAMRYEINDKITRFKAGIKQQEDLIVSIRVELESLQVAPKSPININTI